MSDHDSAGMWTDPPARLFYVEVELPPRHQGDTAVGLCRLMTLVGQKPFRLYAKDSFDAVRDTYITRYEAWPA